MVGAVFQHMVLATFIYLKDGWMEECTETFLINKSTAIYQDDEGVTRVDISARQ